MRLRETPSFAFTCVGIISLVLWAIGVPYADFAAFGSFLLVGCGTAIALWAEVKRDRQAWGWRGLWVALRHPSRWFLGGFLGHLPQLLIAVAIAILWRQRRVRK